MSYIKRLKHIHNTGLSRCVVLMGNIYDLYWDQSQRKYAPLPQLLRSEMYAESTEKNRGITQAIYELNNPIEFNGESADAEAAKVWKHFVGQNTESFKVQLDTSGANATSALEMLRQLTMGYNTYKSKLHNNLVTIIESADLLIPESEINRMNLYDRRRIAIAHDWFSDPDFMNGSSTVILIAESRSSLHSRIAKLPQIVSVEISLPNIEERRSFIEWTCEQKSFEFGNFNAKQLAELTSGLSLHAINQLLLSGDLTHDSINAKVEEYMESQLGEGVVEFKRPTHDLEGVKGNKLLKKFIDKTLIPGFKSGVIGGAAVSGPIGGGKTYICEAIASGLGIPVITLKNLRSQWFGQTDVIFERMRRLLRSFYRIMIFVDEADTQFGGVGEGTHETERRLTGKIQAMMSDVSLKGTVLWFLMTARIHLLSPDIRRPGRMDLIIPVLDPEGEDREEFIDWLMEPLVKSSLITENNTELRKEVEIITNGYSAAAFALLRNMIKNVKDVNEFREIVNDMLPPDIGETREYQTLQAKVNCTRASLLFDKDTSRSEMMKRRDQWKKQISELESKGIR